MQRRRFLAAMGAGAGTFAAGCLDAAPGVGGHPLAGATLTVRIDDSSDGPHDLQRNARESLEFWENHSEEYVDFSIDFEVVEEDDPDMIIAYGDDPRGCENVPEYSERVLGCAPLIREGNRVDRPITARVVAATRPFGKIRVTTKHEIGHILGLDHDDDPLHIMSNRPEDRIPLYELRIEIWETVLAAQQASTEATQLLAHGIESYQRGEYEAATEALEAAATQLAPLHDAVTGALDSTAEFEGHERVETVALDRLRELLMQLRDRLAAADGMATALAASAQAALDGNTVAREERLDTAISYSNEFNSIPSLQLREVAFALGLVRGIDREEQIVELDEEPAEA